MTTIYARHFSLHNQVKPRTNDYNNSLLNTYQRKPYILPRHSSIAFLSMRGGSDEEGNGDVDVDSFSDFVSSFESELMEIRQEAELEAEAELEKLRLMLGEQEPEDEAVSDAEEDEEDSVGEQSSSNEVLSEEMAINATPVGDDEDSAGTDEVNNLSDNGEAISSNKNEVENLGGKDEEVEDIGSSQDIPVVESKDEIIVETIAECNDSSSNGITSSGNNSSGKKRSKSKKSKAKKKSKGKNATSTRNKSSTQRFVDIETLIEEDTYSVESAVASTTIEREVESRPRGISGLIKSDLFRALSLLVATVIVSLMMTRLQRQLESQGL